VAAMINVLAINEQTNSFHWCFKDLQSIERIRGKL